MVMAGLALRGNRGEGPGEGCVRKPKGLGPQHAGREALMGEWCRCVCKPHLPERQKSRHEVCQEILKKVWTRQVEVQRKQTRQFCPSSLTVQSMSPRAKNHPGEKRAKGLQLTMGCGSPRRLPRVERTAVHCTKTNTEKRKLYKGNLTYKGKKVVCLMLPCVKSTKKTFTLFNEV